MPASLFRLSADAVVVVHLAFVVFVLAGGLAALRWRRVAWLHLSAVAWGAIVEYTGWICPLTPLEVYLRRRAGLTEYSGDFIAHYVMPLLYPAELTRGMQIAFGSIALAVNAFVYWLVFRYRRSRAT